MVYNREEKKLCERNIITRVVVDSTFMDSGYTMEHTSVHTKLKRLEMKEVEKIRK